MAEIHRVLKPGGIFALGLIEGDEELYRESSGVNQPRWFSYYSQQEIEQLLGEHDFEVLSFTTFKPKSKNYLHFIARKLA
jgi:SAM-dependent methyltransferase